MKYSNASMCSRFASSVRVAAARAIPLSFAMCVVLANGSRALAQTAPGASYKMIVLQAPAEVKQVTVTGIASGKVVGYGSGIGAFHAISWSAGTGSFQDIHIPGCNETRINGASGKNQVGQASGPVTNNDTHATLWRGTPQSAIDLNPAGVAFSVALGSGGSQQVGVAHSGDPIEIAVLWTGSAASAVNLHPDGFLASRALATDGRRQVGSGLAGVRIEHALLWSGSAQSKVDLHPAGWGNSYAVAIDGKLQTGYAYTEGKTGHALLWFGTAKSVVDLHPSGFDRSQASGIAGNLQVGFATLNGKNHAILWQGTAQSAFDLQTLLGAEYENSEAIAIDELGNIAGKAMNRNTHNWDVILWQRTGAVPRPM